MMKSDRQEDTEAGSVELSPNKISAILFPAFCALLLVCMFAAAYLGTRFGWERYEAYYNRRRYDFAKLYVFPDANVTFEFKAQ